MGMPVRGTHAALEDLLFDPEQLGQGSFDSLGRHRGPELTSLEIELQLYINPVHNLYYCMLSKESFLAYIGFTY